MLPNTSSDQLCGIERHPGSDARGELVAPIIFLWDSPGSKREFVVAVAEHETDVRILERYRIDDKNHFRIEPAKAEWVGRWRRLRAWLQRRRPVGWVSEDFLLNYGKGLAK